MAHRNTPLFNLENNSTNFLEDDMYMQLDNSCEPSNSLHPSNNTTPTAVGTTAVNNTTSLVLSSNNNNSNVNHHHSGNGTSNSNANSVHSSHNESSTVSSYYHSSMDHHPHHALADEQWSEDDDEDEDDDDELLDDEDSEDDLDHFDDEDDDDMDLEDDDDEEDHHECDHHRHNHNHHHHHCKTEHSSNPLAEKQQQLRQKILQIQKDDSIPGPEKARKIQELMTMNWSSKSKEEKQKESKVWNLLADKNEDFSLVTEEDKVKTYHNVETGILGCKHYQRDAKLQAHCCGKWFTCRFCHDEVSDHNILRNLTAVMLCMHCGQVQKAGQICINEDCKKKVAKYYCNDCKLWDDDPRKNIYHCSDCGICRIGKGLGVDYFHCKTCNICMAISLKGNHKCIERNLESDCPICGEYMFTSTTTVIFMPCGHCIHYKCHQEYTQTNYQCPTCFKSLANMTEYFKRIDAMLEQHKMPPEYDQTRSYIYCNDCEKKCWAKYHFLYHKCVNCRGYNTKVVHTKEFKDGEPLPDISPQPSSEHGSRTPQNAVQNQITTDGASSLLSAQSSISSTNFPIQTTSTSSDQQQPASINSLTALLRLSSPNPPSSNTNNDNSTNTSMSANTNPTSEM